MARRFVGPVRARHPLQLVGADDTESHDGSLVSPGAIC
jgi:hypothetical protein